jgi:hypothetical protein
MREEENATAWRLARGPFHFPVIDFRDVTTYVTASASY